MSNTYGAVVDALEPSHAWLRVGRGRLAARAWPGIRRGARVRVAIRPADVVLCAGHPGPTSARNVLPARVRSVRTLRDAVEVHLDAGFPLLALVTRRAVQDLGLRKGASVFALVKATAVVPQARAEFRIRVSVVGRGGRVDPPGIDLLRAVEEEGSLVRAAHRLGISYRTAWLWTRAMNRAWGRPLLDRLKGGRGGGGTVLTPEGRSVLERVSRIEA